MSTNCCVCKKEIKEGDLCFRTPNILFMFSNDQYVCSKKCWEQHKIVNSEINEFF